MGPTEDQKETFRLAYRLYQETSQALAAAQKDLGVATQASSRILNTTRANGDAGEPAVWDKGKALTAVTALEHLAEHYQLVGRALSRQASALRDVTMLATNIIEGE